MTGEATVSKVTSRINGDSDDDDDDERASVASKCRAR